MVALESQNIELMKRGKNQHSAFIDDGKTLPQRIGRHFGTFQADATNQADPDRRQQLEAAIQNQKQAVRDVLTSHDKVQAFQGAAGTGKTTSLTVVRKELEQEGYTVKGFAPTSRAAQQLAECGAECSTLQMYLTKLIATKAKPDRQTLTWKIWDASTDSYNVLPADAPASDYAIPDLIALQAAH